MIKLYCFPRSGNSREVKIVLAEKGLDYESINVHGEGNVKDSPEFKKASPKGMVPAIIDGETYLSEAFLINQYLDQKYPKPALSPADEAKREEMAHLVEHLDKVLVKNIGALVIECLLKPKDQQKEEVKEAKRAQVLAALEEIEQKLEGKQYLMGDYSLADAAVTPHISVFPRLGLGIPENLKNVAAWFERIKARPSFQKSTQ